MPSIAAWIDRHAAERPDAPAVRFGDATLDYARMAALIDGTAGWLRATHGIGRGDRVAWLGTNHPDMLVLLFAVARLGAVLVPLNWRLAVPELRYVMLDCGPKLLVAQPAFAESAAALPHDPAACAVHLADPAAGGLAAVAGAATVEDTGGDADPLLVVYTSGTTGRPKGAVLTQGAVATNAANARAMHAMTAGDRVLTVLPMFHVGGLNIQTTPVLQAGGTVTLHERFDPGATLAAIETLRPSLTVLVPATLKAMIEHPRWAATDLSSLRAVATGSSDVPVELMVAFRDRGVPVIQVYGATETAPVAVFQTVGDPDGELGSIGRPAPGCSIRLVDEDGAEVPDGTVGEIQVKGANVAAGYWDDDAATAAAFHDGWFRTGDLALRDRTGAYWFRDRLKNVIISGGENIYPAELERVLRTLDGVAEAAVVGRADPRWGEVPVAVVVPAPGAARDRAAVLAGFRDRLARFKHPKDVVFVEELPRNALGKVRVDLVKALASGRPGTQQGTR
ncbi:AMP-binding protein [Thalassobaculum sp.]|uniref:AMP-binding protein n=1 Tax=Thalassobaculum sp. TaxID=2022740 RepID=UPI0032EC9379